MVEPDFTDPPTPTVGELPAVGDPLPEFELIGTDLRQITNETFAGTRSDFGEKFGVTVRDSVLEGLLARSVVVADENHKVIHTQMVPGVVTELDYDEVWDILR